MAKKKITLTGKASDFLKIGVAAAARGDVDAVREVLKLKPKWIHRVGSHGRTMLWEASHRGKLPMVKYLVRRKANIDACGTHYTPYFVEVACYCIARFKKHHDVADYLLSKGATESIHMAAFLGDLASVKKFLRASKSRLNRGHPQHVMARDVPGALEKQLENVSVPADWATPLCYALRGGDVETVEYLMDRGATIKGNEPSLFNSADSQFDMVRLLLENGANPSHAPDVLPDDGELYDLITSYGGPKTSLATMNEELVYLCRGDRGGNPDEVSRLLKAGANIDHQDKKGKTALHRAAKAGFVKTIQVLLEHGAKVDVPDGNGETPMFDATRSTIKNTANRKQALKLLLKAGANRKHKNRRGQSISDLA